MLEGIVYFPVLGLPLLLWGGILTLVLLISTVSVQLLNRYGVKVVPLAWHSRLGIATLIVGILHGLAAILLRIQ
jgi:hypothetical protein